MVSEEPSGVVASVTSQMTSVASFIQAPRALKIEHSSLLVAASPSVSLTGLTAS